MRILFAGILFLGLFCCKAQILAGHYDSTFYHIHGTAACQVQDVIFSEHYGEGKDSVMLDLDNDANYDIKVFSENDYPWVGGLGNSYQTAYQLCSLNGKSGKFQFMSIAQTTSGKCDTLHLNDTIAENKIWSSYSSTNLSFNWMFPYGGTVWRNITDHYVGFRLIDSLNSDTLMGWIKLSVLGDYTVQIKELACQSHFPKDTLAELCIGHSVSAQEQLKNNRMLLFPNPFNEEIFLQQKNADEKIQSADLFSLSGQKIMSAISGNKGFYFQTSSLQKGVYVISVSFSNGTCLTKRVVKD